ncbi:histidine phosphatase family protein [Chamaesiphon sp. OTE_20_metabat_361]|uniref:histidine phosphatase family protein n=1 Tax=Chamaesiphon sp. OTE_20_metabat_361 TaxID=2964689 RepID=UPI00286CC18A|nr:histidine phosphatase family protein [Chamaesiphon sp. OTE_20_metabat_361]
MSWKLECDREKLTPQETRVILVRHGQSSFNAEGRYQGSSDGSVLTDFGRQTARQTGEFLSGLTIDALYVSSLRRAQATAREILAQMNPSIDPANIHVTQQLREIDLPAWHGLYHQDVWEKFAEDYHCWKQHPDRFVMVDPHTNQAFYPVLDLYARSNQFWQDTLPRHGGETIMLVSHAGTIRSLISTAFNLSPADYHSLRQSNCGISVMKFSQGNEPQLEVLNYTGHLTTEFLISNV